MIQRKSVSARETIHGLKNQLFSDTQPGTVVKDFSSLLEFIGEMGIPVTAKTHSFPTKMLVQLNQLMSSPLPVMLKRPIQKSFPHVNGLYLLLRASGLTKIVIEKKIPKMVADEKGLAAWYSLNATERYFALLYAWDKRGSAEIVGEMDRMWFCKNHIYNGLDYFINMLGNGVRIGKKTSDMDNLRYIPGFYTLALLELFGFVKITRGEPEENNNWAITEIQPTAWGLVFFHHIVDFYKMEYRDMPVGNLNVNWLDEIKKHVPALKASMMQDEDEGWAPGIVVFKVVLGQAYRKIAVSSVCWLDALAKSILHVFSFDDDHLYEFVYKNRYGLTERVVHPFVEGDEPTTDQCRVGDLPLFEGMDFTFHFDFGDDWNFEMMVESLSTGGQDKYPEPTLVEQRGKPPQQYPNWDD